LLWPRLWDALFDPIMGVIADRTRTRWGRFRPWLLWTAVPWAVVMVMAYTTPEGWGMAGMIAWAAITNTLLMTLYSMNNMPYSALGGVMTADPDERTRLNSFRFVAVNIAQLLVGGLRLRSATWLANDHGGLGNFMLYLVYDNLLNYPRAGSAGAGRGKEPAPRLSRYV
jgi:glycoside/pentoside/hexuronide:cation symporter, GPH family